MWLIQVYQRASILKITGRTEIRNRTEDHLPPKRFGEDSSSITQDARSSFCFAGQP